jgi:hypothetical protein
MSKLLRPSVYIFSVFFLFSVHGIGIKAQPGKSGHPQNPVLLFSYKPGLKRFIPVVRNRMMLFYSTDSNEVLQRGRVTRIKDDSIYINKTGYRIKDFSIISFHPVIRPFPDRSGPAMRMDQRNRIYYRKDSANWSIIIPPDSIYRGHFTYTGYLHRMNHKIGEGKALKYNPLVYNNYLKINIAKLLHCEIALSYEVLIGEKITWEMETGVVFGFRDAQANGFISYPFFNYNGFSFLTMPRFYILSPRSYISCVVMYKYLYFNQVRTSFPNGGEGGTLQDQYRNDYGLSIRIGTMKRFSNVVLDVYTGLGCKYVAVHQVKYGFYPYQDSGAFQWYHPDHSGVVQNKNLYMPIFNFGFSLGFGFN